MPSLVISKSIAYLSFSASNIQLPPAPAQGLGAFGASRSPSQVTGRTAHAAAMPVSTRPGYAVNTGSQAAWSTSGGSAASGASQTGTPLPCPPALFRAASNKIADIDYQKSESDGYKGFIDSLLDAVKFSHDMWKQQAYFSDIRIMSLTASGGKLNGPNLDSMIKMAPPVAACSGSMMEVRDAVAKGVGECFMNWQKGVFVPALPWYPTFFAYPGPTARPTPNIPTPLLSCPSPMATEITASDSLKNRMVANKRGNYRFQEQLYDAIAKALAPAFLQWLNSQQIMLVMGKGPVPTFAPPYVPVGPVLNGDVLPTPGHLSS